MPPPVTPETLTRFDPARRYRAIEAAALRAQSRGAQYDVLDACVESVYAAEAHRFDRYEDGELVPQTDVEVEGYRQQILAGVTSALASFDAVDARRLFDACLLAGASDEQLTASFYVDPLETAAYRHLFFDRNVFPNAFHVVHYIASRASDAEKTLLRIAHAQGFSAIAAQYGVAQQVTPEMALENVLMADADMYRRHRELPLTHQSIKDVRALGKQVVATAQAIQKVQESRAVAAQRSKMKRDDEDFVLVTGPANPTLEELLAAGGVIAVPPETKL